MPSLVEASLTDAERRTLDRLTRLLADELGDDLLAVWLYGSRARGEAPHPDSDVDLLIVRTAGDRPDRDRLWELVTAVAEAEGANPFGISARVADPDWIADRRSIDAFFIREVDRDRIVLAGSGGEEWQPESFDTHGGAEGMRHRTEELLVLARERARSARLVLDAGPSSAVSLAYQSMLSAARAALSEEDLFARTHSGTWHLFHEAFVATGRFDGELASRAANAQREREDVDYAALPPDPDDAAGLVRDAERFLALVEDTWR